MSDRINRAGLDPHLSLVAPANAARVEDALLTAVRHHAASMIALHAAVEACVGELVARDLPPEGALRAMKGLVHHVAGTAAATGDPTIHWAAEAFMEDVVRWTIGAYYGCEVLPVSRRTPLPGAKRTSELRTSELQLRVQAPSDRATP